MAASISKPNLIYTVAVDPAGSTGYRTLSKLLALSLRRTFFSGEVIIFRNSPAPLFYVERKGIEEIYIATEHVSTARDLPYVWSWKYRVAATIDTSKYEKIMFLDADCMALKNVDHLFECEDDVLVQREKGCPIQGTQFSGYLTDEEMTSLKCDGVNSGQFMMRSTAFRQIVSEWERVDSSIPPRHGYCRDQSSLNRVLLDTNVTVGDFPQREVVFPFHTDCRYQDYMEGSILHGLGISLEHKVRFMFGLYSNLFLCDPLATMLHIWES